MRAPVHSVRSGARIDPLVGPTRVAFWHLTAPGLRRALLRDHDLITLGLTINDRQAGLIVGRPAWAFRGPTTGIIESLCVAPEFRNQGHGKQLIAAMEEAMAMRGMRRLHARWIEDATHSEAVASMLQARGWADSAPDCMLCRSDLKLFTEPFARTIRFRVEPPFSCVPWSELTDEDHATVRDLVRTNDIGPGYDPNFEPHLIEPTLSLALKRAGCLIGWQINHLVNPTTVRYTKTWILHELRSVGLKSSGIGFRLAMETVRLCRDASDRIPNSIMLFSWDNARMQRFFERRLRHGLTSWSPILESGIDLPECTSDV